MNATLRRARLLVVMVGLAMVLAACGSSDKSGSSGGGGGEVTINGAGSSFQKAFDEGVIAAFQEAKPDITVNYDPSGSGAGKTALQTNNVNFAGTDSLPAAADKSAYQGGALLNFPTVAAPITVSYNLSGVDKLQLSGPTLAKIFSRKITKWDDAAIAADNPGVTLPSTDITVARRADSSGTTANFTRFLSVSAPDDWKLGTGDTVAWPADTQAGTKNTGVAQIIKQTDGAVGYVDLADATASDLTYASIKNKAGKYVVPSVASASAALANTKVAADLSYDPINASGADAYPITSPTWIIVYKKQTSHDEGTALQQFLQFIYSDGEAMASDLGYAPLPTGIVQKAGVQIGQLEIPS